MLSSINIQQEFKARIVGNIPLYIFVVILVFSLAIIQDYIYSRLQQTGFYLSESLLYNTFWLFFIPLTHLYSGSLKYVKFTKNKVLVPTLIITCLVVTLLHILFFVLFFVLVSNIIFTTPHRFSAMLDSVLSRQFYIAILWYLFIFVVNLQNNKLTKKNDQYKDHIQLKIGTKTQIISAKTIQLISTDKPYCADHCQLGKVLDSRSLKEFEAQLDPFTFYRIHRSAIINHHFVLELESRQNGDYDAKMENGEIVRLSRHYRNNWKNLLQ